MSTSPRDSRLDLEKITALAVAECRRQGVGLDRVALLLQAYCYALESERRLPSMEDALVILGMAEPTSRGEVRRTPVTFAHGGSAASPDVVERALQSLFEALDEEMDAEAFTKEYLWIHPGTDGNGRSAWLLLNWVRGSLLDPVPLPEFDW